MTNFEYIGKSGRVTAAIRGGGSGEVMLTLPGGGSQAFTARALDSSEDFEEGHIVWVSDQSGRTVYVVGT